MDQNFNNFNPYFNAPNMQKFSSLQNQNLQNFQFYPNFLYPNNPPNMQYYPYPPPNSNNPPNMQNYPYPLPNSNYPPNISYPFPMYLRPGYFHISQIYQTH